MFQLKVCDDEETFLKCTKMSPQGLQTSKSLISPALCPPGAPDDIKCLSVSR